MAEKTRSINQKKINSVNEIKEFVGDANNLIFTDYRSLTVQQMSDLRKQLREKNEGVNFRVVKNSYTKIALEELGTVVLSELIIGPTALAVVKGDPGVTAKVLYDFARVSTLVVKGGFIEGKVFSSEQLESLSRLPGKDQLLAMLLGAIQSPLSNLVYALNGVLQNLAGVLHALQKKKEGKTSE